MYSVYAVLFFSRKKKKDQKKCAPVISLILAHGAFPGNAELAGLRYASTWLKQATFLFRESWFTRGFSRGELGTRHKAQGRSDKPV